MRLKIVKIKANILTFVIFSQRKRIDSVIGTIMEKERILYESEIGHKR